MSSQSTITQLSPASSLTGAEAIPADQSSSTVKVLLSTLRTWLSATAAPLMDGTAAVGSSPLFARQDHVHPTDTTRAPVASPTFTGVPAAPTAAQDTNTTQVATTGFVVTQASAATPLVDGTAAVGTSLRYARADHIHPTDTSRAASGANSDITSLAGLTTPLSAAQGGTAYNGGAWPAFTPSVAYTGGAGLSTTSPSGGYLQIGKLLIFRGNITVNYTTIPTGINITLPNGASAGAGQAVLGYNLNTGSILGGLASGTSFNLTVPSGGVPFTATGQILTFSATLQVS